MSHSRRKFRVAGRDQLALLCGLWLRFSNEYARNEHECSAKSHLQSCGERWRIHVPVPYPGDDPEFDKDVDNRNPQGQRKIFDKKWEGVARLPQCLRRVCRLAEDDLVGVATACPERTG